MEEGRKEGREIRSEGMERKGLEMDGWREERRGERAGEGDIINVDRPEALDRFSVSLLHAMKTGIPVSH